MSIVYTRAFLEDMLHVTSPRVEDAVFNAIELLPYVPALGSSNLPPSIAQHYGDNVRKTPVASFDIIYKQNGEDFIILALILQKQAF